MAGERTKNGTIRLASGAFDAVYRHLTDGVIVRGRDGVILYGNPSAECSQTAGGQAAVAVGDDGFDVQITA